MLVHQSMSFIAIHVTKICCFNFVIWNFCLVTSKMRYFEFRYLEFFEEDRVFFALNFTKHPLKIQRLFVENSQEQRTNFDELRLHYFCKIL